MAADPQALLRAGQTESALRRSCFDPRRSLYGRRRLLGRWTYECLWPYSTAWSASAALATVKGADASRTAGSWLAGLSRYADPPEAVLEPGDEPLGLQSRVTPPIGGGGDRFYDDNAWIGLALVRQHSLDGDPALLGLARRVLDYVLSGWSTEADWVQPGGIAWKESASSRGRNTCANGPAAELALEIASQTGDTSLLEWARRIYAWVRGALLLEAGLYADHLAPDGVLDTTLWSYNQGTMIGAGVLLARATGELRYLEEADETARASLARYRFGAELAREPPVFAAVYLRNLLLLGTQRPDRRFLELARSWTEEIWRTRRSKRGLVIWGESVVNATAPLVEVEALLAGAPPLP